MLYGLSAQVDELTQLLSGLMRQLRCFRSLLCSEPGDAERVHVISLGALQFLLSEAPSTYWVEQRNSEAVCRERGEQVPPVVTGRLHRHQTVSWIAENISKRPIPVSVDAHQQFVILTAAAYFLV